MDQRLGVLWLCVTAFACAQSSDVTSRVELGETPASLFGGHTSVWKPWHRHHRHHHHARCRDTGHPAADSCTWSNYDTGLIGAPASFVFFDPRLNGLAYAVSGGSVWRSTDSGETWQPRSDLGTGIVKLMPDGTDDGALIAATNAGLHTSDDAAATWSELSLKGLPVETLEIPVVQPQRVYTTIDQGPLLLSRNEGAQWGMAGTDYPRANTMGLSVDPRDPLQLLTALQFFQPELGMYSSHAEILHSADGGASWQSAYNAAVLIHTLKRCPSNPDVILAGTQQGVLRSRDNGESWTLIPIASQTQGTIGVTIDPHDCDDFYALQANDGPVHTRDGGASFSAPLVAGLQLTATGSFPGTLAIDPQDAKHLILSTHGGFYASHDAGEHWAPLPIMLFMNTIALAVSPQRPSEVWLATWGQGVWKRSSSDTDWEHISIERLPRDYLNSFVVDPHSSRVLAGANGALFSEDGETFRELNTHSSTMDAAFDPSDPNIIYLTTQISGIYKSSDAGQSWQQANSNLPTWRTTHSLGIDTRAIAINPARPAQLFLATNGRGIYRSDDAAATWTQVLDSPEVAVCLTLVAAEDAQTPPRLYACLSGVSMSDDGGQTWRQLSQGLPELSTAQIVHDAVSGRLYVTTSRGVFVLDPNAESWRPLDPGCDAAARGMAIMEENGQRYLVVGAERGVRRHPL